MIPHSSQKAQKSTWQSLLKRSIVDPVQLLNFVEIDPCLVDWINPHFKLKVPLGFAKKIVKGCLEDPILKQILPLSKENIVSENYDIDPLKERSQNPLPGLIHKFKSRVLVMPATRCPIHCRYCFRRHFPYDNNNINLKQFAAIGNYIEADPNINEIVLSGGDPLYASDHYLHLIIKQLTRSNQIKIIRFHSRFPITMPERIDSSFIDMLAQIPQKIVLVVHCNHPQELCEEIRQAVIRLKQANVTVLNQGVILKGINDDVSTLKTLSYRLFECGIMPYYMNQLDLVSGSAHFEVEKSTLLSLQRALLAELPGYLVPKFVQEQPFTASKVPLIE